MIVVSTTGNLDFSHCGDYTERKSRHGEKNAQISIVTWKISIQESPQIMITYGVQAVHYFFHFLIIIFVTDMIKNLECTYW